MRLMQYYYCFVGILKRELLRFVHQHSRFIAALVRPLVWLFIFAVGLRSVLGDTLVPPYNQAVPYEVYITPGLIAMIILFSSMQSSLSIVYDREMGSMRTLLISPFPRWYLLVSKLFSGVLVSMIQVLVFLCIALFCEIQFPLIGYVMLIPIILICGMMMSAFGLLLSSIVKQLENFAGIMNFVIFPLFFASTALYPLKHIQASSELLYHIASVNPLTHAIELIRFAAYGQLQLNALIMVSGLSLTLLILSCYAYNPSRGFKVKGPSK